MICSISKVCITHLMNELIEAIKAKRNPELLDIPVEDFITLFVSYWAFNNPNKDTDFVIKELSKLIKGE